MLCPLFGYGSLSVLVSGRKGKRTLIAIALIATVIVYLLCSAYLGYARHNWPVNDIGDLDDEDFILNQPSCRIPRTDLWPEYFEEGNPGAWHVSHSPNCGYEKQLAVLEEADDGDEILRLVYHDADHNHTDKNQSDNCCVSEITRKNPDSDYGYNLSNCEPLQAKTPLNVTGKHLLLVKCGDRINFEATVPTNTPAVKSKFEYWKRRWETGTKTANASTPINILLIGLEATSRSNAYRSLPRTLGYMTSKMGFIDFQGYHAANSYTQANFAAMLMGMTDQASRNACLSKPGSMWDDCPFIWKEFDAAQYVTAFMEDGSGTYSCRMCAESGFRRPPTDYYMVTLFDALTDLRRRHSKPLRLLSHRHSWKDVHDGFYMSSETVPQFMLRYTRRFLDKFNPDRRTNTTGTQPQPPPFFALTFLAYPFHDDMYALSALDEDFFRLMHHLNSKRLRTLLESTIVMLFGDHGERYKYFQSDAMEAYIERSTPPLFIRMPEQIRERFPDYVEALKWNAASRLVTPFDLHQTMLHLLHLDEKEKFVPVHETRTSLFSRVEGNRACEQLSLERCVCNVSLNTEFLTQPSVLGKLRTFLEERLNQLVVESGYEKLCANWTTKDTGILSARILQKKVHPINRYSPKTAPWLTFDVAVKIKADPGQALFDVKVRLQLDGVGEVLDGSMKLLSDFTRVNLYGKQSDCIQIEKGRDKKMKELCFCLR